MDEFLHPEISHDFKIDKEEFEKQIEKYDEGITSSVVATIVQEQANERHIFLQDYSAKSLIEEAESLLKEIGYKKEGTVWIKE